MVAAKKGSANKLGYIAAHSAIVLVCVGGLLDGDMIVRAQMLLNGKSTFTGGGLIANVPAEHRLSERNPGEVTGYAVALPDMTAESALILLEEIRQHFSGRPISPEIPRHVQLSVGIAAKPPHAKTIVELLRCADEALYRAKREGRSRVAIYVEDKMSLKSNFYPKAQLERLAKLSNATGRTEASILREGLEDVLVKHREEL